MSTQIIGRKVIVNRFGQSETVTVVGICWKPIKNHSGQLIEQGEFLGFDVQNVAGHRYCAQEEQMGGGMKAFKIKPVLNYILLRETPDLLLKFDSTLSCLATQNQLWPAEVMDIGPGSCLGFVGISGQVPSGNSIYAGGCTCYATQDGVVAEPYFTPMSVRLGDQVLYKISEGSKIMIDDETFVLVRMDAIFAVVQTAEEALQDPDGGQFSVEVTA